MEFINKFWEGLGSKLNDQRTLSILLPAFAFWFGGFIAWVTYGGKDWQNRLETFGTKLEKLPLIDKIALLIGGLLVIVVSSSVIECLNLTVLRWLEGYWPRWLDGLKDYVKCRKSQSLKGAKKRFDELLTKEERRLISPGDKEYEELVKLDLELRLLPEESDLMPTELGNILRAAETRPTDKYGLVTAICWPRLWLLLPQETKQEITESRALLDAAVRIFIWGCLFLVWVIWAWWVPFVTLLVTLWTYRWSLSTAKVYGDLLEFAFDLYRFALYEAIHYPLPKDTGTEWKDGWNLTNYLLRGPNKDKPAWGRALVAIGLTLILAIILKRSLIIDRSLLSRWLTVEKS